MSNIFSYLPFVDEKRADIIVSSFVPMLKGAFYYSIPLTLLSFFFGMIIALAIALVRVMPSQTLLHKVLHSFAISYISIIRGTPLLVQLFIIFYGLPSFDIQLDPFPSAVIAFSLNIGAYAAEIVRAAILSIAKGQWEAGYTIGMSYFQIFKRIIVPQALRVSVPPLSNTFISLIKDSSLASLVLVAELFKQAQIITARNYEFMLVYIEAALIYWVMCLFLSILQTRLERRLDKFVAV